MLSIPKTTQRGLGTDARFLLFCSRIIALILIIITGFLWAVYGYDSTVVAIFKPELNGLGVHFSTLQLMCILYYFLIVNFHVGGLTKKIFIRELKTDLKTLFTFRIVQGRRASLDRIAWRDISVIQGVIFSGLGVLLALFLFELPYVHLLNYFHFGDLLYPIYGFGSDGYIQPIFYRNVFLFVLPVFFCLFWFPWLYRVKLNYHRFFEALIILIIGFWFIWVSAPQANLAQEDIHEHILYQIGWDYAVVPMVENGFPQNVYLYYSYNETGREVHGFHIDDPLVHTLNIVVKYLTFAWVGSLLLVRRPSTPALVAGRARLTGATL